MALASPKNTGTGQYEIENAGWQIDAAGAQYEAFAVYEVEVKNGSVSARTLRYTGAADECETWLLSQYVPHLINLIRAQTAKARRRGVPVDAEPGLYRRAVTASWPSVIVEAAASGKKLYSVRDLDGSLILDTARAADVINWGVNQFMDCLQDALDLSANLGKMTLINARMTAHGRYNIKTKQKGTAYIA